MFRAKAFERRGFRVFVFQDLQGLGFRSQRFGRLGVSVFGYSLVTGHVPRPLNFDLLTPYIAVSPREGTFAKGRGNGSSYQGPGPS